MAILIFGSVFFLLAFLLHSLACRLLPSMRQARALLLFFLTTMLIFLVAVFALKSSVGAGSPYWPQTPIEYFYIGLFHVSLTLAYFISWPGFEAESPSALIVTGIEKAGGNGLSQEELSRIITDELFVHNRIGGLLTSGMLEEHHGEYTITDKGVAFLNLFLYYRRLMKNLPEGG